MADISKVTLPSGNTYNIKDQTARDAIAALEGGSFFLGKTTTPLTDGATTNPITIEGASDPVTVTNGNIAVYGNAEFIWNGSKWVEFGDLSTLGGLATKDTVSLNKGSGDQVLGEATTFTAASSNVTFGTHTTETFVKSVTADTTKKLVTTTIPNVTSNSDKQISIAMGSGTDAETLIFSGDFTNNVYTASKTALGTAITAATGSATTSGTGTAIVTNVTIGDSASAITALGAATAAAQTITVGTNDKVKIAKYNDLSVTVS